MEPLSNPDLLMENYNLPLHGLVGLIILKLHISSNMQPQNVMACTQT
jgi:hypothetical protein